MGLERIIELLQEFDFDRNTKEDTKYFIEFICYSLQKLIYGENK
jgi:hypothetical protein